MVIDWDYWRELYATQNKELGGLDQARMTYLCRWIWGKK